MFDKFKSAIKTPEIEFLCLPEDEDVIAKPYHARHGIPEWYKKIPQHSGGKKLLETVTVKKCAPFVDAMTVGWIIPLVADIQVESNSDNSSIRIATNFYKQIIQNHKMEQITSNESPNPICPVQPLKFLNYWMIKVPKDYSVLFVPPLNNPDKRFTCFSGFVDCDEYFNFIHFPFVWNIPNYSGIVKAGTPLVQAIPIPRNHIIKKSSDKKMNNNQIEKLNKSTKKLKVNQSYYRNELWHPKFK